VLACLLQAGLPDANFNEKPKSAKKRPEKAKRCRIVIPFSQKNT